MTQTEKYFYYSQGFEKGVKYAQEHTLWKTKEPPEDTWLYVYDKTDIHRVKYQDGKFFNAYKEIIPITDYAWALAPKPPEFSQSTLT